MSVIAVTAAVMVLVVALAGAVLTYAAFPARRQDVPLLLRWTSPLIRAAERARSGTLDGRRVAEADRSTAHRRRRAG